MSATDVGVNILVDGARDGNVLHSSPFEDLGMAPCAIVSDIKVGTPGDPGNSIVDPA